MASRIIDKDDKFTEAMGALSASIQANRDIRLDVNQAFEFVDKPDGQWEPDVIRRMKGKPRYTDDRVNPIVNQIAGELENAQFTVKVRPASSQATMQLAQLRDGIIRHIRHISGADSYFNLCGRRVVKGGFAAALIEHDYVDDDSFDQDLLIRPIHDAHMRVWLDEGDQTNNGSGATMGWVMQFMPKKEFEKEFGRQGSSLKTPRWQSAYYYKPENIVFAHYYYVVEKEAILYSMSDGKILKSTDTTEQDLQALADSGVMVEDTRTVMDRCCYFRMFDAKGWLSEPEETVFDCIPIIPAYAHFEVSEGKILCRGAVDKLIDVQRVHNYAFSREVEEVALSPRKKYFMTEEQAAGHEQAIASMNTNMDPVQLYNHVPDQPPPYEGGAPNVNVAVANLVVRSDESISRAAGLFAPNMGANTNLQSGVALELQIDRGNNGTSVYFESMEVFITRVGQVLNKAIPKVYDGTRQLRIINESGAFDEVVVNNIVVSGDEPKTLNDLSVGQYDVVCDVGAAYKNRQQEAAEMFLKVMERDPNLISIAGDVWLKNINAPGFDIVAKRARAIAIANGVVLPEEMTQEERTQHEQAKQQPKEPSAEEMQMKIALLQAETANTAANNQATQHQIRMQELQIDAMLKQKKTEDQLMVNAQKLDQGQQRIDLEAATIELQKQSQQFTQVMEAMKHQRELIETLATALMATKNAMGVDAIISQPTTQAFTQLSDQLVNATDDIHNGI